LNVIALSLSSKKNEIDPVLRKTGPKTYTLRKVEKPAKALTNNLDNNPPNTQTHLDSSLPSSNTRDE
jgi:hypothetical protein